MFDFQTFGRRLRPGALLLAALACVAAAPLAAPGARAADGCAESVPFVSGTEGYHAFRIPAVVSTGSVVLAFAEGRRDSLEDHGDIDVVARRSFDGGCSWEPLQVVAGAGQDTIGNPAPVVDPATGRVTLLMCGNDNGSPSPRRVFVGHSDDDGASWSDPRDITAEVNPDAWSWYATGPGHGLALAHGADAGRLLVPANHTYEEPAAQPGGEPRPAETRYGAHSLVSDDGGDTWHVGYVAQPEGDELLLNENTFAELPDGRIYSNVRNQFGTSDANRADAYLAPGGTELLSPYRAQPGLAGPVVQGSTLLAEQPEGRDPLLLYSGPAEPDERAAMTLRVSADGGAGWRDAVRLSDSPAAYSDLVQLGTATVGLLYETGPDTAYDTITFARVPVEDLQPAGL